MTTYTLTVSGLGLGAHTANSLSSDFTSPATTVSQNTTWTPLNVKYLAADTDTNYTVKSISGHDTRDMEVVTWVRKGYVYLRLDSNGKAIYFLHNGDDGGNGTLECGIVTGLTQASFPSGTYYKLYSTTNCVADIPGYSLSNTTGDAFTFGVSGFDIYMKFDPGSGAVEFARFKEYRHMASGGMALKSSSYGFRDIAHTTLSTVTLASDYANNEINMGDWGMRTLVTTGSISSASTSLTVADATGFLVGDYIIVEAGTESGAGARGTVGVGGTWPTLSYATTALLLAATPANYTFAWARDTGQVYRYGNPGPFDPAYTGTWNQDFPWNATIYYMHLAIPRSLLARITVIAGNVITLDTAASAAATSANVYLDNQIFLNDLLQDTRQDPSDLVPITWSSMVIKIPAGSFCLAGSAKGFNHSNWSVKGSGKTSTFLFSAAGLKGASIYVSSSPSFAVSDLTISGNFLTSDIGYGVNFYDTIEPVAAGYQYTASGIYITRRTFGQVGEGPAGILDLGEGWPSYGVRILQCDDCAVRNVTANDVMMSGVEIGQCDNGWAYNCTVNAHAEPLCYLQWQFELANDTNSGLQDCDFISTHLRGGFEQFANLGTNSFIRCTSVNGLGSINACINPIVTDFTITIPASASAPAFTSLTNPMFAIDTNTGSGSGGRLTNVNMVQQGYIGTNGVLRGIAVDTGVAGVSIIGGSYTGPDYAGSSGNGPVGIDMTGAGASVSCFTSLGTVKGGAYNISVTSGSVVNSRADLISAPTQSGNVTSASPLPAICNVNVILLGMSCM